MGLLQVIVWVEAKNRRLWVQVFNKCWIFVEHSIFLHKCWIL